MSSCHRLINMSAGIACLGNGARHITDLRRRFSDCKSIYRVFESEVEDALLWFANTYKNLHVNEKYKICKKIVIIMSLFISVTILYTLLPISSRLHFV